MDNNVIDSLGRRNEPDEQGKVTSFYAEAYYKDTYCDSASTSTPPPKVPDNTNVIKQIWESPSDAIIPIVDLTPPLTSKITRGKTHEGILAIGEAVLAKKRAKFLRYLSLLLQDNDASWTFILNQEKKQVEKKVRELYMKIYKIKCKVMSKEISIFLEETLKKLEAHMRTEMNEAVITSHADIVRDLNIEIKEKLLHERKILEDYLKKKYDEQLRKVRLYYKLLLEDQVNKHTRLVNSAIIGRNTAVKTFCDQMDAETLTSTLYMMSIERKKCKIKQFFMKSYQDSEIKEKLAKIKKQDTIIKAFVDEDVPVKVINRQWEEKVKKILEMFLKFIGYSLKLLPEQSTFLLDLEKLFILQMNEIQKAPLIAPIILQDEEKYENILQFPECQPPDEKCTFEPFVLELNPAPPTPPSYGSRESLATDVDLPWVRVQRQFVYARCHGFEEIKEVLDSTKCKCHSQFDKSPTPVPTPEEVETPVVPSESSSSFEPLLVEDLQRLELCPSRACQDWFRNEFPYLETYMDYTEENFNRVQVMLGKLPPPEERPQFLNVRELATRKVPFAETTEPTHNVATQYSSQENLYENTAITCTCVEPLRSKVSENMIIDTCLEVKRRESIKQLIEQNPALLKFFTSEDFDFQL